MSRRCSIEFPESWHLSTAQHRTSKNEEAKLCASAAPRSEAGKQPRAALGQEHGRELLQLQALAHREATACHAMPRMPWQKSTLIVRQAASVGSGTPGQWATHGRMPQSCSDAGAQWAIRACRLHSSGSSSPRPIPLGSSAIGSCMPRLGHVAGCQVRLRAVQRIAARQVEVGGCKILWVKTPKIRLARSSVRLLKRCSVEG